MDDAVDPTEATPQMPIETEVDQTAAGDSAQARRVLERLGTIAVGHSEAVATDVDHEITGEFRAHERAVVVTSHRQNRCDLA